MKRGARVRAAAAILAGVLSISVVACSDDDPDDEIDEEIDQREEIDDEIDEEIEEEIDEGL